MWAMTRAINPLQELVCCQKTKKLKHPTKELPDFICGLALFTNKDKEIEVNLGTSIRAFYKKLRSIHGHEKKN